jgi:hypothetical protein
MGTKWVQGFASVLTTGLLVKPSIFARIEFLGPTGYKMGTKFVSVLATRCVASLSGFSALPEGRQTRFSAEFEF